MDSWLLTLLLLQVFVEFIEELEDSLAFTKAAISHAYSNSKTKGSLVLRAHKITQEDKKNLKNKENKL